MTTVTKDRGEDRGVKSEIDIFTLSMSEALTDDRDLSFHPIRAQA